MLGIKIPEKKPKWEMKATPQIVEHTPVVFLGAFHKKNVVVRSLVHPLLAQKTVVRNWGISM